MIHYVCDACKRPLASDDLRYVVRMEVYAALDETDARVDEDRDHLGEIHEFLEGLDEEAARVEAEECRQLRFDLCEECRKTFLLDPLGRRIAQSLDFSQN